MQPFPQIFPVQKYKSGIATKHKILPKKVKQILNVKFLTCKCRQDLNIYSLLWVKLPVTHLCINLCTCRPTEPKCYVRHAEHHTWCFTFNTPCFCWSTYDKDCREPLQSMILLSSNGNKLFFCCLDFSHTRTINSRQFH